MILDLAESDAPELPTTTCASSAPVRPGATLASELARARPAPLRPRERPRRPTPRGDALRRVESDGIHVKD